MSGIDAKSDAIYELVEQGSAVEKLAGGFTFTEGPIWHPEDEVLYFSDMPADIRRKVTLDGEARAAHAGTWIAMPPGMRHAVRASTPLTMALTLLRPPVA